MRRMEWSFKKRQLTHIGEGVISSMIKFHMMKVLRHSIDEVSNVKCSWLTNILPSKIKSMHALMILSLLALCLVNILLVNQNRQLKAAIAHLITSPDSLEPGDVVPAPIVQSLSGKGFIINFLENSKTVLLVFSTECSACERILPYWREIIRACQRNEYSVFGISLDGHIQTTRFLQIHDLALKTFIISNQEIMYGYKLHFLPQTIVIDQHGRVERIWRGVFRERDKADVEEYFGISLTKSFRGLKPMSLFPVISY